MALNTVEIPNTVGATFRTNINNAYEGVGTNFSGTVTPTTANTGLSSLTGALWYDTSVSLLKVHNGSNFVNVDTTADVGATAVGGDLSGTVSNASVANDSHTHDDSTIDSLNTSATTAGTFNAQRLGTDTPAVGEVLTATSTTAASWQAAAGGGGTIVTARGQTTGLPSDVTQSGGTFTYNPSGSFDCLLTAVGGGGGGGKTNDAGFQHSAGSGAGGVFKVRVVGATSIAWTIGAGGGGGGPTTGRAGGANGGNTVVTITGGTTAGTLTCPRGRGGTGGTGTRTEAGTAVSGTPAAFVAQGIPSTINHSIANITGIENTGAGGLSVRHDNAPSTILGSLGLLGVGGNTGDNDGKGYGSGGGSLNSLSNTKGGDGTDGVVILELIV